jgi:hypothetical protein
MSTLLLIAFKRQSQGIFANTLSHAQVNNSNLYNSIRVELTEPFLLIQTRMKQLERVQSACDLMRKVMRFLYTAKRLKSYLEGSQKLPEAAECLYEIGMFLLIELILQPSNAPTSLLLCRTNLSVL